MKQFSIFTLAIFSLPLTRRPKRVLIGSRIKNDFQSFRYEMVEVCVSKQRCVEVYCEEKI